MGQQDPVAENKQFGHYLRRVREERKLSLDAVEEMSSGFPERLTKSHLSRIENGQAVPTFPRIFALSQIYGIPIASMAERFEIDLTREMFPADIAARPINELMADAQKLSVSGRYSEALVIYDAILDLYGSPGDADREQLILASVRRVGCLSHLARYAAAKEECEDILSMPDLPPVHRVETLQTFAICCYRLSRFTFALMALDLAEEELRGLEDEDRLRATLAELRGILYESTGDSRKCIEQLRVAIKQYKNLRDAFCACRAELNLASALVDAGSHNEARRLLDNVRRQAEKHGYDRLLALAISTLAVLAYKGADHEAAEAHCLRSNAIARPREYVSVVFRNCYYLWRIARARGDLAGVKTNERALRTYISRVEDFVPEAKRYRSWVAGGEE